MYSRYIHIIYVYVRFVLCEETPKNREMEVSVDQAFTQFRKTLCPPNLTVRKTSQDCPCHRA